MSPLKELTYNNSWSKLLPALVKKKSKPPIIQDVIQETVLISKDIAEERFVDAKPNDFYELIESEEQLSAEEIEEKLIQPSETEDKNNDYGQTDCLNLKDLSSILTAMHCKFSNLTSLAKLTEVSTIS